MKSRYKYSLLLLMMVSVIVMMSNCSKEEAAKPNISYVRITNPNSSDSLLASAGQGQMIAIMGSNLQSTQQVWFNDQMANLIPTYVTGSSILVRVPSQIPMVITNKVKLVFANKDSLLYDFIVNISKPVIDHVRSEYVNTGDSLFIYGNYFYLPLTVTFSGGAQGEILSVGKDNASLVVKMPSGVQPGPLTITTNFGTKASDFWMQDNRNVILPFTGPLKSDLWHPGGGDPASFTSSFAGITSINGDYMLVNTNYGTWGWSEILTGQVGAEELAGLKNIPAEAFTNPKGYNLKFEVNTLALLTGVNFFIYIGPGMSSLASRGFMDPKNPYLYTWKPNLNTNGVWQTISIPWSDFYLACNSFPYNASGYDISFVCQGPNAATLKFAMDNVRVVPVK